VRYFIIAGEASGDLHGSNLVKEIKKIDSHAEFIGWGGNLMLEQGVSINKHISQLAFMGFVEVAANLRQILKNFRECKKQIVDYNPDAIILVDYPGFNLRIARFAKKAGFKIIYYISPTVWAWHKSRIYTVRDYTDLMFTILPFEQAFYAKYNISVEYEGHPLIDIVNPKDIEPINVNKKYIALLPGSRKQEIKAMLPIMLKTLSEVDNSFKLIIAGAPAIKNDYYKLFTNNYDVEIVYGNTYGVLKNAYAAIVTSGTATLETALMNVPQIVCYKTSFLSYHIAKTLANVEYISLVNLILNKPLLKELIQNSLTVENLKTDLVNSLFNNDQRTSILKGYEDLRFMLGNNGVVKRIAIKIVSSLS